MYIMPLSNKNEYNSYMKYYRRNKRAIEITRANFNQVILEFSTKSTLPRHIYEFRLVLRQMLKTYFKKKIIRVFDRTEIITLSWSNYC